MKPAREDWCECPCGYRFDASTLRSDKHIRFRGGKFLNKSVEQSCLETSGAIPEVRCPKCEMWFNYITGEIDL